MVSKQFHVQLANTPAPYGVKTASCFNHNIYYILIVVCAPQGFNMFRNYDGWYWWPTGRYHPSMPSVIRTAPGMWTNQWRPKGPRPKGLNQKKVTLLLTARPVCVPLWQENVLAKQKTVLRNFFRMMILESFTSFAQTGRRFTNWTRTNLWLGWIQEFRSVFFLRMPKFGHIQGVVCQVCMCLWIAALRLWTRFVSNWSQAQALGPFLAKRSAWNRGKCCMAWVTRQQKTNNKFICLGDGETCKLFWKKTFFKPQKNFNRFQTFLKAEASSIQWRPCSPSGHSIFSKAFVGTKFGGKVVGFFIFDAGVWKCCRNTSWLQGWNIWCGYHPGYFKGGHHWEQGSLCRAIRQGLGAKLPFPFAKSWAECQKSKTPKEKKHLKLNPKRRPETGGLYEEKWLPPGQMKDIWEQYRHANQGAGYASFTTFWRVPWFDFNKWFL